MRLSNLLLLVGERAREPRTDEALRTAYRDPSPRVRLRAAIALGPEGHSGLLELAKSTEDDECSAQALRIVGRELPFERTTAILKHALRSRHIQTAWACLETLGSSGADGAIDTLAKVAAQEESVIAVAAAQALGTTASAAAEPPLIQALRRDLPNLGVASARALGRVGSATAVLPLKEAAERLPREPDLAAATRQAIEEIQSRLSGASPGQLSLAGAETGHLSLATDPAGQLSLPSEETGRLSLSEDEEKPKPPPGGTA